MNVGVVFPQTEIGDDPAIVRDYAIGVEAAGYSHLVAFDHVLGHRPSDQLRWAEVGPYTDEHAFHEVFVLFGYLAAVTTTLEFATEVLVLPQRQAPLVAKQAAELQVLSRGRFRLGIGVGWNPEEYRALGMNFQDRGKRVTEQVEVLRRLWSEEVVTFKGQYHSIEASGLRPRPPRPIPIWIGGSSPIVLKRAAEIADGFVLDHNLTEARAVVGEIKRHLAENMRAKSTFGLSAFLQVQPGVFDVSLEEARGWEALGLTHLSINTMNAGIREPRDHLQVALSFMDAWRRRP